MKIIDISQEVFSCAVYPGDPKPEKQVLNAIEKGDLYNAFGYNENSLQNHYKAILYLQRTEETFLSLYQQYFLKLQDRCYGTG